MTDIRQIVYMSTAKPKFSQSEIEGILHAARERNRACGVTGILVYGDGNIIQALEGPPDTVGELFDSISRDARHKDVIKVLDLSVEKRDFPNWRMAYARSENSEDLEECVNLLSSKSKLIEDMAGLGIVGSILRGFVDRVTVQ